MYKRGKLLQRGFDFFGDFLWLSKKKEKKAFYWGGGRYLEVCLDVIRSARKQIDIAMYQILWTKNNGDDPVRIILEELIRAQARGVRVRILVNKSFVDLRMQCRQDEVVRFLLGKGIWIKYCGSNEVIHAKVLIVDGEKMVGGSANWTRRGLLKNVELNLMIDDSDFVGQIEAEFSRRFMRKR